MHRALLPSYLLVAAGLIGGFLVAMYVVETEPRVLGWAFSLGGGLAVGAFIAAIASNTPLAGRAAPPRRRITFEDLDFDREERDPRGR